MLNTFRPSQLRDQPHPFHSGSLLERWNPPKNPILKGCSSTSPQLRCCYVLKGSSALPFVVRRQRKKVGLRPPLGTTTTSSVFSTSLCHGASPCLRSGPESTRYKSRRGVGDCQSRITRSSPRRLPQASSFELRHRLVGEATPDFFWLAKADGSCHC